MVTYNQVESFQVNDYANHYVDIEITGYRELYSTNCNQQCLHVYNIYVCCLTIYQEFMVASTQLSHFGDLTVITEQTYCKQSHQRPMFNTFSRYVMCYTVNT